MFLTTKIKTTIIAYRHTHAKNIVTPEQKEQLQSVTTSFEIVDIIGEAFYILVPVESSTKKGKILEGAMIKMEPETGGNELVVIQFTVAAKRFRNYEIELDNAFNKLVKALIAIENNKKNDNSDDDKIQQQLNDQVEKAALEMFYYWVNLTPLSRGSR